jgi:hypothetical protein
MAAKQNIFPFTSPQSQIPQRKSDKASRPHNPGDPDGDDVTAIEVAYFTLLAILAALRGGAR